MGFDMLVDITCVDYLNYRDATDRFGLVYLLAIHRNERATDTVRVYLNEPDLRVPPAGQSVGGRGLDGARSVGHVRHSHSRGIPITGAF